MTEINLEQVSNLSTLPELKIKYFFLTFKLNFFFKNKYLLLSGWNKKLNEIIFWKIILAGDVIFSKEMKNHWDFLSLKSKDIRNSACAFSFIRELKNWQSDSQADSNNFLPSFIFIPKEITILNLSNFISTLTHIINRVW